MMMLNYSSTKEREEFISLVLKMLRSKEEKVVTLYVDNEDEFDNGKQFIVRLSQLSKASIRKALKMLEPILLDYRASEDNWYSFMWNWRESSYRKTIEVATI